MNRLGNYIFAGTRFTRDQNAGIGRGDPLKSLNDAFHAVAGVDQVLKPKTLVQPLMQLLVLLSQSHRFGGS